MTRTLLRKRPSQRGETQFSSLVKNNISSSTTYTIDHVRTKSEIKSLRVAAIHQDPSLRTETCMLKRPRKMKDKEISLFSGISMRSKV